MVERYRLIAEYLKSIGILDESQIREVLKIQAETGGRLSDILTERGFTKTEQLKDLISSQFGLSPMPMFDVEVQSAISQKISPEIAYRHRLLPIKFKRDILTVATDDPINFLAQENLESLIDLKFELVLTFEAHLNVALERHYGAKEDFLRAAKKEETVAIAFKGLAAEAIEKEEAPIIKLVTQAISDAVKLHASDIHLEPLEDKFRIRYRVDGVLHEITGPPKQLQSTVISRVKIMAGLNIAEKRLPQDGRIRIEAMNKDLDIRVSTLPSLYGESVVMRLLDKSSFMLGLRELGFSREDEEKFEKLIRLPHGMLLVTGPTGSGKTTTLYASLSHINKPNKKLITVEDPVEYQLSGVNQVQVKPSIGLTFASGLRTMLRQAPDVIMVGEIRDFETASIAIQAALTGHLIFSTLHTNDAPGAITRLIDMGVKPYLVSSTVKAILAQRLVRKICNSCSEPYTPTKDELFSVDLKPQDLKEGVLYRGRGCKECAHTGFRGRIGIFELLTIDDQICELIVQKASSTIIRETARKAGMKTLRDDGVLKILAGITTIPEVVRITHGYEE